MDEPTCAGCRELLKRVAELEAKLGELEARLGQNASNSSIPPSANPPQAPPPVVKKPTGRKPGDQGRQQQKEGTVAFRKARQNHPGVESVIGALQKGNGLKRARDRRKKGYERYVALGILGRNLQTLGKLLLEKDKADCQAAKSKRVKHRRHLANGLQRS